MREPGGVVDKLIVVKDTASRDFAMLVKLGLLERIGSGRRTRYIPGRFRHESTDK